jgi:ArsR family transcriptional regulator
MEIRHNPPPETAPDADDQWLADACRAIGNPVRVQIVRLLAHGGCVCGKIVDMLPLAQSTVSQHLKVLRTAGLIKGVVEGPFTCYCLDRDQLARLKELISSL